MREKSESVKPLGFKIGDLNLGEDPEGPDPGPKNAEWHLANSVEVKQIPGKEKRSITIRTSDRVLWECTLTVRSITDRRYIDLKHLVEDGGPFVVICNHGRLRMYIVDATITHDEKDKEKPLTTEDGEPLNVATWVLRLQEAND